MAAEAGGPRTLEGPELLMSLSAKLAAEVLMGRVRMPGQRTEPPWVHQARTLALLYKRTMGEDNCKKFLEEMAPAMHTLVDALFDELTGVRSPKTQEQLKKLSVPVRVAVEQIVAQLTGRGQRGHPRWEGGLWELKETIDTIVNTSISGIGYEDLRSGYDPLVHTIVDELYARRELLLS